MDVQTQRMNMASLPADACTLGTPGQHGDDRITHNFYDSESRVTQVQRAYATPLQQNYATYTYDTSDRRTGVTDANGNRAAMRYDGHGRQTRWVFPSPATAGALNEADYEDYGYDLAGNRTSLKKRDGVTLTYAYDALNRLLVKSVPERQDLEGHPAALAEPRVAATEGLSQCILNEDHANKSAGVGSG